MILLRSLNINILALYLLFVVFATMAHAQDTDNSPGVVDILPAKSLSSDSLYVSADDATHPPVRLTPDKSELIRLDQEAGTIIIGNPAHLTILADSAKTLVLVPQTPGATHFTVLDRKGNVLMQRHVIVASPKEKYIRIRRSCASSKDEGCQPTRVYYCPDMCHEIAITSGEGDKKNNLEGAAGEAAQQAAGEDEGDEE